MKMSKQPITATVFLFFLLLSTIAEAQFPPTDTISAHGLEKTAMTVFSFEDTDWDETTSIPLSIQCNATARFKGYIKITDNSWFGISGSDSIAVDTTLSPGDSIALHYNFTYDTTNLPFYAKEIVIEFVPDTAVIDSLEPERMKMKVMQFFTPYRTLEIWNEVDFNSLQRIWFHGEENASVQWSYMHRDSIPVSDIPSDTVIPDSSVFEYMPKYKSGLAYIVPMMPTAEFLQSLTTAAHKADGCGPTRRRYYMSINNIRIMTSHVRDHRFFNLRTEVPIYVKNATVDFFHSKFPSDLKIASLKTDDEGYIVNSSGSRSFTIDFCGSSLVSPRQVYPVLKLHWPDDMNRLRLKFAGRWVNYASYTGPTQGITGGQGSPTPYNSFSNNEWVFPVDHPSKSYTFINWAYDLTNDALSGTGHQLNTNLAIKIETSWDWGNRGSNYYNGPSNTIHFSHTRLDDEATHFHEFGHYVMDVIHGTLWNSWGTHNNFTNNKNFKQTVSEGFADGLSYIMDEMTYDVLDQESGFDRPAGDPRFHIRRRFGGNLNSPFLSEDYFGRVLLDLWDGPDNLSQFNVTTNQDIDDQGNDSFQTSLKEILRPLFENQGDIKDIEIYYEEFLNNLSSCEDRAHFQEVWHWNMDSVVTTGAGAVDPTTFQFLNSDEIKLPETAVFYTPIRIRNNGTLDFQNPISIDIERNVFELNFSTGDFNFGEIGQLTDALTIDDATLFINNSAQGEDWVNDGNPPPALSHTIVDICGDFTVNVNGTIQVGDANRTSDVLINGELNLDGNLIVNDNSKVTITETGTLNFGEGAIQLNGNNAVLEIQGALNVSFTDIFTFTGSGKVIFNSSRPNNINLQAASRIELIGSGPSDVVAEIHQKDLYVLYGNNASSGNRLVIRNGKVLMGNKSRLACNVPIELYKATVDRLNPTDQPRGFEFYGQSDITVDECSFSHCRYGIRSNSFYGGKSITITNSDFNDCRNGLFTIGAAAKLQNCNFNNNTSHGWRAEGMYFESDVKNSHFNNNGDDGINHDARYTAGIKLYDVQVDNNGESGLDAYGIALKVGCSYLQNNALNGIIYRGHVAYLTGKQLKNTGENKMSGNDNAVHFKGLHLYMDRGKNNLQSTGNQYNILGSMWPFMNNRGRIRHNAVWCDKNVWDLNPFAWNDPTFGNCDVENSPMFMGGTPSPAFVYGPSQPTLPLGPCDFVDIDDPWGRDHGQPLAHFPGRIAPVLAFADPGHEFNSMTLDDAVDLTLETFYDETQPSTAVQTINRAQSILTHHFTEELDTLSVSFYHDAYNIMIEAAVKGVETGEIELSPGATPPDIQTVINTMNQMLDTLNDGYTPDRYWAKYLINMNKAMLYRVIREHTLAIGVMNDAQAWIEPNDQAELDFLTCHTEFERDVIDGLVEISSVDFDSIYTCLDSTIIADFFVEPDPGTMVNEQDKSDGMIVYPNPSEGISTVYIENPEVEVYEYVIYNLNGAELQRGELHLNGDAQAQVRLRNLPGGIYILKANGGNQVFQLKFFKE